MTLKTVAITTFGFVFIAVLYVIMVNDRAPPAGAKPAPMSSAVKK